jgi:hypothetical protein
VERSPFKHHRSYFLAEHLFPQHHLCGFFGDSSMKLARRSYSRVSTVQEFQGMLRLEGINVVRISWNVPPNRSDADMGGYQCSANFMERSYSEVSTPNEFHGMVNRRAATFLFCPATITPQLTSFLPEGATVSEFRESVAKKQRTLRVQIATSFGFSSWPRVFSSLNRVLSISVY